MVKPSGRPPGLAPGWVAIIVALVAAGGTAQGAAVPVSTSDELLNTLAAAAAGPGRTTIDLQTAVRLDARAVEAGFVLPIALWNRELELRGASGDGQTSLDFGGIAKLLHFTAGGKLFMIRLNVTGVADPMLGSWPTYNTSTVAQTLPFWPTITAEPGFELSASSVSYTLGPTPLCVPEVISAQAEAFRTLASSSGTGRANITSDGDVIFVHDWAAPVPLLDSNTQLSVGTVRVEAVDTSVGCTLAAEPPSGADGSSGGTGLGGGGQVVVPVHAPGELLFALSRATAANAPGATTIELHAGVALDRASAAASYNLPFTIEGNRTLELRAAPGEGMADLALGHIPRLLYFKEGGRLLMTNLNVSGMEDPLIGSWPEYNTTTVCQLQMMWPTISSEAGFALDLLNTNVTLHPTDLCDPAYGQAQADALFQLASSSGNPSDVTFKPPGSAIFKDYGAQLPLLSSKTRLAVGTVFTRVQNSTTYCTLPKSTDTYGSSGGGTSGGGSTAGGGAAEGAATSQDSGGTPGWVWAVVAIAAAAAAAAVVLALVWYRRRSPQARRLQLQQQKPDSRQQQQQLEGVKVLRPNGEYSSELACGSAKSEHDGAAGGGSTSLSPNSSAGLDQAGGMRRGAVPEGPWKSRMGVIEGLQMGSLIGRGGFAKVYKGRWKGTPVAVKVIDKQIRRGQAVHDLRAEPLLSLSLSHPNVLQSYKVTVVRVISDDADEFEAGQTEQRFGQDEGEDQQQQQQQQQQAGNPGQAQLLASASRGSAGTAASGGSGGGRSQLGSTTAGGGGSTGDRSQLGSTAAGASSRGRVVPHLTEPNCMVEVMPQDALLTPGLYELWLMSELGDQGNLAEAMAAGKFEKEGSRNMPQIMHCLLDIARGLEYLHSCQVVHGDLKPQNVMLKAAIADRRGYIAKLGDFGLSRILRETESHVQTGSAGTVTHAAPELLSEGRLTFAADIFAYGRILYELVTGLTMFEGMGQMQVAYLVTQCHYRPPMPLDFPPPLASLALRCWDDDPTARPCAETVVREVMEYSSTFSSRRLQQQQSSSAEYGVQMQPVVVLHASQEMRPSPLAEAPAEAPVQPPQPQPSGSEYPQLQLRLPAGRSPRK